MIYLVVNPMMLFSTTLYLKTEYLNYSFKNSIHYIDQNTKTYLIMREKTKQKGLLFGPFPLQVVRHIILSNLFITFSPIAKLLIGIDKQ